MLSQIINVLIGFYLYGKKVFKVNKITKKIFRNYLFLAISIFVINSFTIALLVKIEINKNLAALYVLPFLVWISFYIQNKFVFTKKNEI